MLGAVIKTPENDSSRVEAYTKGSEASTWNRTDSLLDWPSTGTRASVNFFKLTALRIVAVCLTSCAPGGGVKDGLLGCCGSCGVPGPPKW